MPTTIIERTLEPHGANVRYNLDGELYATFPSVPNVRFVFDYKNSRVDSVLKLVRLDCGKKRMTKVPAKAMTITELMRLVKTLSIN